MRSRMPNGLRSAAAQHRHDWTTDPDRRKRILNR